MDTPVRVHYVFTYAVWYHTHTVQYRRSGSGSRRFLLGVNDKTYEYAVFDKEEIQ
jgi:hypothetical protein